MSSSSSLTASRPELPSASWMSARIRPGRLVLASVTAAECVRATPSTRWPRFSTSPSRSMAMKVSSSMMSTSVAISAASSRPDCSTKPRTDRHIGLEDRGGVLLREALQRDQQEGLAGQRGDVAKPLLDRHLGIGRRLGFGVHIDGIPDFGEQMVQRHARRAGLRDHAWIGNQGFQRRWSHRRPRTAGCRSGRAHSGAGTADAG